VVADIGCGLGDLLTFLRHKDFTQLLYRGYDILPDMVARAVSSHHDSEAVFQKIDELWEIQSADYCFASGIFNAKLAYSDERWWDHVQSCIREMAAKSKHALVFNMLSRYSDRHKQERTLYYADPCQVFDWCKREISRDVALLHDYGQWDFTIIIRTSEAS
jgi:trans-aconitate methyltransferase